jgi:hypothetical protein
MIDTRYVDVFGVLEYAELAVDRDANVTPDLQERRNLRRLLTEVSLWRRFLNEEPPAGYCYDGIDPDEDHILAGKDDLDHSCYVLRLDAEQRRGLVSLLERLQQRGYQVHQQPTYSTDGDLVDGRVWGCLTLGGDKVRVRTLSPEEAHRWWEGHWSRERSHGT